MILLFFLAFLCEHTRTFQLNAIIAIISTSTREALADTLVEVRVRSVQCEARGGRSKLIFSGSGYDDFRGFSTSGLVLYVRAGKMLSVFVPHHGHAAQSCTRWTTDNMHRAQRCNAAAQKHQQATPCVCDNNLPCTGLAVVFIGACGP